MSGPSRSQAYGRHEDEYLAPGSFSSAHMSPGGSLPGSLQAGRPGPVTANTAPSAVPTLPPLSTSGQQPGPSRGSSASQSHSHSYSRSSPAAALIDDPGKYGTPPAQRFGPAQTPQSANYSPLALGDIRQMQEAGEAPPSANPFADVTNEATSCNYLAPWAVYAFDWCKWPVQQNNIGDSAGKVAVGSYLEDGHNYIQILEATLSSEPDDDTGHQVGIEFSKTAEAAHSYPVTRILWEPESAQKTTCDLLATSGDHLRLWSLPATKSYNTSNSITRSANIGDHAIQKLTPLALLSNSKSPEHTAPLTSLDWNTLSPSLIITSSIDTTCTIWDIPSLTAKTQLIAHDKEVFDVRFCANSVDVFVSCGADGSVRMFDLRSLEHSTIIYEPSEKGDKSSSSPGDMSPTKAQQTMSHAPPLLRLAASPFDAHHLATFSQESNVIRILDVRQPGQALLELSGHQAPLNCLEWSPLRRGTLASGADDSLVLVWDLMNQGTNGSQPQHGHGSDNGRSPAASWQCEFEVNNLSWAPQGTLPGQNSDWLGVSGGRGVWAVAL